MTPQQHCQAYVVKATDYICTLSDSLDVDAIRVLMQHPMPRDAEAQVDAAALAGDIVATKQSCRAWWAAWRTAITQYGKA